MHFLNTTLKLLKLGFGIGFNRTHRTSTCTFCEFLYSSQHEHVHVFVRRSAAPARQTEALPRLALSYPYLVRCRYEIPPPREEGAILSLRRVHCPPIAPWRGLSGASEGPRSAPEGRRVVWEGGESCPRDEAGNKSVSVVTHVGALGVHYVVHSDKAPHSGYYYNNLRAQRRRRIVASYPQQKKA